MKNYGITKGTPFEKPIEDLSKGEAGGASMYAALAYIAKEKELNDVSDKLMEIAIDELRHAGFYTILNGQVDENIFEMLKKMAPVESSGVEKLQQFAETLKNSGLESVAKHVETIASDEGRHGKTLEKLIEDNMNKV